MTAYHEKMSLINRCLMALLAFSLPISTALTNVALAAFILFWLLDNIPDRFKRFAAIIKGNPLAAVGILFFLLHLLGIAYTSGGKERILESVSDGAKFLFIPMVMVYIKDKKTRSICLHSFVIAMGFVLLFSYLIRLEMLPEFIPAKGKTTNCYVFLNHIAQNVLMAYTAFITAVLARFSPHIRGKILWGSFSLLAFCNVLFLVHGRTGHMLVIVLLMYYIFSWKNIKSLWLIFAVMIVLVSAAWFYPSSALFSRAVKVVTEARSWEYGHKADRKSSTGLRLEFYTNSLSLIKKHPVIGTGTGSFETEYMELIKGMNLNPSDNPHNEYLMIGVQFGIIGVAVFLAFLFVLWWYPRSFDEKPQVMLGRGLALSILFSCLVSSTLQDNAEGWFFAFFCGLIFAQINRSRPAF